MIVLPLLAIQFIRPQRNSSAPAVPQDFLDTFHVGDTVKNLLANSCFDCHSNNTRYPWYTNIQPVSWLMANHIKEGKEKLNFNELAALSIRRRNSKFKNITEQIDHGEMPLKSYLLMHNNAKLSPAERTILIKFFQSKINN